MTDILLLLFRPNSVILADLVHSLSWKVLQSVYGPPVVIYPVPPQVKESGIF